MPSGARREPRLPEEPRRASAEPGARVMRDELTYALRKMPHLQKPATVEREDHGSLFRFPCDTLSVGKAIGQAGEKLASQVLSGCSRSGHQPTR